MQKLNFEIKNFDIEQTDSDEFYSVLFYAISSGENRNMSNFTPESLQKGVNTVNDKPIMAYYSIDNQNFEEHNSDIILSDNEEGIEYKYLTSPTAERPIGLIDKGFIINKDGKEWLCLRGRIWALYCKEAVEAIENNIKNRDMQKVSVEINVNQSHKQFSIEIIDDFTLTAITMLGNLRDTNVPCESGIADACCIPENFSNSKQFRSFVSQMNFAYNSKLLKGGEQNKMNKTKKAYSVNDDEFGKSPAIDIKNKKEDAVMSGSWSKPNASVLNAMLKASNHTALMNEFYLGCNGGADSNLSINDVHYPHHTKKGNSIVVNAKGCQAALSRGMAQGNLTPEMKAHLKKHYKELGLNMENFEKFGLSHCEYSYLFKEEEDQMKKFISNAKEHGYSFVGISNSSLIFTKDKECNEEDDLSSEDMKKMSLYTVDDKDIPDDECFAEESFKEKDLKMADDSDPDDGDDDKKEFDEIKAKYEDIKAKYDELEKECNALKENKASYDADKTKFDEDKKAFEEDKKAFESKKLDEEKAKKEAEEKKMKEDSEKYISDESSSLDEDSIKELRKMRDEKKFASINEFVKEAAYMKEMKRLNNRTKSTSVNYSFNNYTPVSKKNNSSKYMTMDEIIKENS